MIVSKVACPRCQAVLRSEEAMLPGTKVKCPRCAMSFTVPGPAAGQATPALAEAFAARPRPNANGLPMPHLASAPALRDGPEQGTPRHGFWLVLLSLATLMAAGGAGVAYYLWMHPGDRHGQHATSAEEPDDFPTPRRPQPLIVLTPQEEKQVQDITGKAVAFLKKTQRPDGSWDGDGQAQHVAGSTGLAGLTLLECGVKADDPAVQKAVYYLRDAMPRLSMTYELSLTILFFSRYGKDEDKERIQKLALRVVAGQQPQGGWTYVCPILSSYDDAKLLPVLKDLCAAGEKALPRNRARLLAALPANLRSLAVLQDVSKQPGGFFRGGGDNSNTQFALLALWTAHRDHLPVEASLALVARRFQASQNADGSWNYSGDNIASPNRLPTMTCAGLIGLAVGYGVAKDTKGAWGPQHSQRPADNPAVQKAIACVGQKVGDPRRDPKAPRPPMTEMYFLWSVERVAVLWRLKTIPAPGGKQWYQWGLDMLAPNQRPDGSWQAGTGVASTPLIDTCFALLFLQRANLVEDLMVKLQELAELPVWGGPVMQKE
jgi:hypothetical protein